MTEIYHNVIIGKDVVIEGDVKILHGAIIRDGVKIKGSFVIAPDVIIDKDMIEEPAEDVAQGIEKETE